MSAPLHDAIEIADFADWERDGAVLFKDGSIGLVIELTGRDTECLDDEDVLEIGNRFEEAVRSLDKRFRIYQYQVKDDSGSGLFLIRNFVALTLSSGIFSSGVRPLFSRTSVESEIVTGMEALSSQLHAAASQFIQHLNGAIPAQICNAADSFKFLSGLLNYDHRRAVSACLKEPKNIGWQATMSDLETFRGALLLGDTWCKILTLKSSNPERALPEETVPDFLREIREEPVSSIIVTEYRPIDPVEARKRLEGAAEHHHRQKYKTSPVTALANIIGGFLSKKNDQQAEPRKDIVEEKAGDETQNAIASAAFDGVGLGEFTVTIIIRSQDRGQLNKAVESMQSKAGKLKIGLFEEQMKAQKAWFAALPGGHRHNGRRMLVTEHVYADMSLLYAPDRGNPWNDHLNATSLMTLETRQKTRYDVNLHEGQVGHTLMMGKTGYGKTFTCIHILESAEKYDPIVITFDMKESYRDITIANGGTFMTVGKDGGFKINPFCLEPTRENLDFLNSLVSLLIERSGFKMTMDERKELWAEIKATCTRFPVGDSRRRLGKLYLPDRLRPQLEQWIGSGRYGWLFDNVEDTLSFAEWQGFSFGWFDEKSMERLGEPLLYYILHRASDHIVSERNSDRFKLFLIDEAWLFFKNETIREYVKQALKTWRDKNAAVLLATQSPADIEKSEIFESIIESISTMILLGNPKANGNWYKEKLGLNEVQVEHVKKMRRAKELMIVQGGTAKVARLNKPAKMQSKTKSAEIETEVEVICN